MRGFFRLGLASDRANLIAGFSSVGLVWRGLIGARPDDDSGIAIAYAGAGSAARAIVRATIGAPPRGEAVIELNHRLAIDDGIGVQPHVQYIVAPGFDPTVGNALVLGLRLTATIAE
jgi:porin